MAIVDWGGRIGVANGISNVRIAALSDGTFVVLYQSGSPAQIMIQRFSAAGEAIGEPISPPQFTTYSDYGSPEIITTSTGFLVLVTASFQGSTTNRDNVVLSYANDGTLVGVTQPQDSPQNNTSPDGAEFAGRVFIASVVGSGADAEILLTTQTVAGGSTVNNTIVTSGADSGPSLDQGASGSGLIVWSNGINILGRAFNNSGALVGSTFTVAAGSSTPGLSNSKTGASVTAIDSERYLITYSSFGSSFNSLDYVILNGAGTQVASGVITTFFLGFGPTPQIQAVAADGGYYLVVSAGSIGIPTSVFIQRYDRNGVSLEGAQLALQSGEAVLDIDELADGRLAVVLEAAGEVRIQIVDPRDGIIDGGFLPDTLFGNDLYNDQIKGGLSNDALSGLNGNDRLDGGSGDDVMTGGAGDDVYVVDSALDQVIEIAGDGVDTVYAAVTFDGSVLANQAIENITLTGTANINATGYNGRNVLTGNSGNNELNGKGGDDVMSGGLGDDTYIVDRAGDLTVEKAGQGFDTVKTAFTHTLQANVEKLVLLGSSAINGTGNASDNNITGNDAANIITGGLGRDVMDGRGGNDTFDFNLVTETAVATPDRITDLAVGDKVDFSTIDANTTLGGNQAFTRVAAFNGVAGQMTITFNSGAGITDVRGDVNGDGTADFRLFITGDQTSFAGWVF